MSLRSAVYGFAVGDALGVPYEFRQRGKFECKGMTGFGTWNQPVGTWSDDTSMVLATCDSIGKNGGKIKIKDIADRFLRWYNDGAYSCNGDVFDIGRTTASALNRYQRTGSPYDSGLTGDMDNGNGGLMRILPLAFIDQDEDFIDVDIARVCAITHNTNLSQRACQIYVNALIMIERQGNLSEFDLRIYSCFHGFERLETIRNLPESEIRSTGYVVDTLEAALWCFTTTDNYRDCVLKAVNLGDDADTVAALAGGLAGAKYGMEGIPKEWVEQLRNKETIEGCLFETNKN